MVIYCEKKFFGNEFEGDLLISFWILITLEINTDLKTLEG